MKRTYPTISCQSCGSDAKAPNKQTKWCSTCRLGKGAAWHDGRARTCACGRPYIAWNGKSTQRSCGVCFEAITPEGQRESVRGTCNICKQDKWLYSEHIRMCFACIDRPEKFAALQRYIIGKMEQLQKRFAASTIDSDGGAVDEQEEA